MKQGVAARLRGFVDSTDRSPLAVAFRTACLTFSIPYSLGARLLHGLYDRGVLKSTRVPCPTISVGNVTMGGVGKSPFVAWLADYLIAQGRRPGLVSRGYKAKEHSRREASDANQDESTDEFAKYQIFNDEAKEFALRFPDVPYFLGPRRVEVADALLRFRPDVDTLILDDAFQHRKIARDLNIVMLDALNPFGGGRVVPSGFLREPLSALKRADVVLLNRADLINDSRRETIRQRALSYVPDAIWGELAQRPLSVYRRVPNNSTPSNYSIRETSLDSFRHEYTRKRVLAFCGLGAPAGFRKTLENSGLDVVDFIEFPDHCAYTPKDLERLARAAYDARAEALLATMKDFTKFNGSEQLGRPFYALRIGVEFLTGEKEFCTKTIQTLQSFKRQD
ncbi:MAG: tetraacyldisaccharide 4'-kinase [Thermoguttaceae bacterium]|jgi:tetraacyldisaccharide 4'-kinase